jgi:hypothetical protein
MTPPAWHRVAQPNRVGAMTMKHRWDEVNQMRDFLEAEIQGRHFDRNHAHHLAKRLAETFPVCRQSFGRMAERMAQDG